MKFYLYNDVITPEYEIPSDSNFDSLKQIYVHDDLDDDNHFISFNNTENSILVKLGKENQHPMTDEEYIEFFMLEIDGKIVNKIFLNKNAEPNAFFLLQDTTINQLINHSVYLYAYCNLTGLWKRKFEIN